jgi:hypothetical protein
VGAIGDTDDEGVTIVDIEMRRWDFRGIGRKGPAEQLTIDSMDHLEVGADVFTGTGTITRSQQSDASVGFATQP